MPKFLFCTKQKAGPHVLKYCWYDYTECEQGAKEKALKHVRWVDKKQIEKLSLLQSSPSPIRRRDADQSVLGTWCPRLQRLVG